MGYSRQKERGIAKLNLANTHAINKITLYDRPNSNDQITAGTVMFSDGTSIATGSLNNNGTATTLTFPVKTITSVRLNITGVSSTSKNIGLSEIQVYEQSQVIPTPTIIPTPTTTATPTATPPPTSGNGLQGQYFNSINLPGAPVLTKVDTAVNFDWGFGSPGQSINTDFFSVRWTGFIKPLYSQTYSFCAGSDDGEQLWINNTLVTSYWVDQGYIEHCGNINLQANTSYPIKLEFYDRLEDASIKLYWESPSQTKQIIPTSNLFIQ